MIIELELQKRYLSNECGMLNVPHIYEWVFFFRRMLNVSVGFQHSQSNQHSPSQYPRIMKIFGHILLKSENMPVKPNIFCTSVREISQLSTIEE